VIVGSLLLILVAVTLLVLGLTDGSSPLLVGSIGASLLAAIALVIGARQAAAARAGVEDYLEDRVGGEREGDEAEGQRRRRSGGYAGRGDLPDQRVGASAGAMTATMPAMAGPPAMAPPRDAPSSGMPGHYGTPAHPAVPGQYGTAQPSVPSQYGTAVPDEFGDEITDDHDRDSDLAGGDLPGLDDDEDPLDEPASQVVSAADAARVARMSADVLVIDGRPRYHLAGCVHLLGRDSEPLPVGEAVELGFTPCSLCEPDSALLADARRV
jgi:hypothetical protein